MASPDQTALIRYAAEKAVVTINRVSGTLALLGSSMGDIKKVVEPETVEFWHGVASWLLDRLEDEAGNLEDSLQHDELAAMAKQVKS